MAFSIVSNQVITLFFIMSVGYILTKISLISEKGVKDMTTILLYVVTPSIIIHSFQLELTDSRVDMLRIAVISCFSIFIFAIVTSEIFFRDRFFKTKEQSKVVRFSTVYSNAGFMGLPLLEAVLGQEGLFMGSIFVAIFNIFVWTHGIMLYSKRDVNTPMYRALLNPNLIAIAFGIVLFIFPIHIPRPVDRGIYFLSTLNTPLAMIVIGNRIAGIKLKELYYGAAIWIAILARNIAMPLLLMFALHFSGVKGITLLGCILPVACPTAGNTVLFAEMFGSDSFFAARLMTLSTLLSLLTIPLIVYIFTYLSF